MAIASTLRIMLLDNIALGAMPSDALAGVEPDISAFHFAADDHLIRDRVTVGNNIAGETHALLSSGTLVFSRASAAWGVGPLGYLQQFASGVPRLVFDPASRVTSTSYQPLTIGQHRFNVSAGFIYQPGDFVAVSSAAAPSTKRMRARVVSQVGNLLTVDVYRVTGWGNAADWVICKSLGYLPELSRGNYFARSIELMNGYWTAITATRDPSTSIAPDGTTTAITVTATGTSFPRFQVVTARSLPAAAPATKSVYVRAGSAGFVHGTISDGTNGVRFFASLSTGATTLLQFGASLSPSIEIEPAGGGWWRVSVAITTIVAAIHSWYVGPSEALGSVNAQVGQSIDVWGPQDENGRSVSSFIPTTDASVTRLGDVFTAPLTKLPFNPAAFTVLAETDRPRMTPAGSRLVYVDDGTEANRSVIGAPANDTSTLSAFTILSNVDQGTLPATGLPRTQKPAYAVATDNLGFVANGSPWGADLSATLPGYTTLRFGMGVSSGQWGHPIASVILIPRRLSQAEMIERTAA